VRNQVLITLDSLRWDVFEAANLPFLKSYTYGKTWSHGTYTLPAHESFFVGKMPHSFTGAFDWAARSNGRNIQGVPLWRVTNPESPGPGHLKIEGQNLIDAFNKAGFTTIGTGAVNWFNTNHPAHIACLDQFKFFRWFGPYIYGLQQIEWCIQKIRESDTPVFIFINFGETHHRFQNRHHMQPTDYGNPAACFIAQRRSAEYLDTLLQQLFESSPLANTTDAIVCGDHGESFGEDGLWGHGFYHPKVMEVPSVIIHT